MQGYIQKLLFLKVKQFFTSKGTIFIKQQQQIHKNLQRKAKIKQLILYNQSQKIEIQHLTIQHQHKQQKHNSIKFILTKQSKIINKQKILQNQNQKNQKTIYFFQDIKPKTQMQSDPPKPSNANNQPTPQRKNQINPSFLQRRKQQMKQQAQKRQKQQQRKRLELQQRMSKENNFFTTGVHYQQYGTSQISTYQQQDQQGNPTYHIHQHVRNQDKIMGNRNNYVQQYQTMGQKKVSEQDILKHGLIVKVVEICLNKNDFKIQCVYDGQMVEIIASKQEIVKNNIIPLLDFYQRHLGLNQKVRKGVE